MAELGDEEMSGMAPKPLNDSSNKLQPFGYYIDENGYKRKGRLPQQIKTKVSLNYESDTIIRTNIGRYD